jgi:acetylglutamate synthase
MAGAPSKIKSHLQLQPMNVVQNEARNRSPHSRRNRRNKKGESPCLFSSRQPICQIQDDAGEVSCFSEAEKKSHNVQLVDRCTTPLSVATMSQLIRTSNWTTLTDPSQDKRMRINNTIFLSYLLCPYKAKLLLSNQPINRHPQLSVKLCGTTLPIATNR